MFLIAMPSANSIHVSKVILCIIIVILIPKPFTNTNVILISNPIGFSNIKDLLISKLFASLVLSDITLK